jgi:hypothetical protein
MPPPIPCGTPYSQPCPPIPCQVAIAKLDPAEQEAIWAHITNAYETGREHGRTFAAEPAAEDEAAQETQQAT